MALKDCETGVVEGVHVGVVSMRTSTSTSVHLPAHFCTVCLLNNRGNASTRRPETEDPPKKDPEDTTKNPARKGMHNCSALSSQSPAQRFTHQLSLNILNFLPTQNARLRLRATSSARGHRAGTRRVHFPPFTRRGCPRSSRSLRLATRSTCCCFAVQPRSSRRPPPDFSNPSSPLKNHSPRLTSFPELRPNTSRFPPPPTHAKRRRNTSGC